MRTLESDWFGERIVKIVYENFSQAMLEIIKSENLEESTTDYNRGRFDVLVQLSRVYSKLAKGEMNEQ